MPTWLEQRQPGEAGELLQDYPHKVVRIECQYCDRTERYGLAWLVRRFGPAAALPEVLAALSDDCPRRHTEPCGAAFPDLSARLRG
jgi:hypothetical protein